MSKIRQDYISSWKQAYDGLNEAQKHAVDTIEGPVMTIAGPGTGKTQLLAVRIGKILMETDVLPHNILCLTYTEAGVVSMRQRLNQFIGPEAHHVNIHTFHAFCNSIIQENLGYFGDFRALKQVSDIEEIDIYRTLIDGFDDDHLLKKLKGDIYNETRRLKNLFSTMKQERWTTEIISAAYEQYKSYVLDPITSPFRWGRSGKDKNGNVYQKGDFNFDKANKEVERYDKAVVASRELQTYDQLMRDKERFDYQDMILWVIQKLKDHDELLAKYQERFQYILIDEYQDTNGAQNELIFLLADFWESPNLFIVGDDDQSIFRFQGANMSSILEFREKYHPTEIILTNNYRSSQKILDQAKSLIENNQDRLVNRYSHLTKDLIEARQNKSLNAVKPMVFEYQNESHEEASIIQKIAQLHQEGVAYKDIAVIYTKHKSVASLVKYFSQNKIPINVKKRVNVLQEHEVAKIITILRYLDGELSKPHSREDLIFEILHYSFFGLSAGDVAIISIECRKKSENDVESYKKWRETIRNAALLQQIGVQDVKAVLQVSHQLETWLADVYNITIQTLIEKILTEGNILNEIINGDDQSWQLQLINTFFDFIKNEASKVNTLTLQRAIELIDIMLENHIELPVNRIISNKDGLHFLTVYGSKGLEFEHVFMIKCHKKMWEDKSSGYDNYILPPTITSNTLITEIEDDRRLFYVAMTRAKTYLYISYPITTDEEKPLEPSQFVAEILGIDDAIKDVEISQAALIQYKTELMKYQKGKLNLIDHTLIERVLENFKVSATSLNKYLKCRLTFYFENILRVPLGRSATMGFGNAIHYSLEHYFRDIEASSPRSLASVSKLIAFFNKGMDFYRSHFTSQEFVNYTKHGTTILTDYYEAYHQEWLLPKHFEVEYNIPATEYDGVPISGKLDRIDFVDDVVTVRDYKTGRYDASKLKGPQSDEDLGGDYWRQMVFYAILIEGDKKFRWQMNKGIMDFVEKDAYTDKYKKQEFKIEAFEIERVGHQLKDTYQLIKSHTFTPGCGLENCKWCNFVQKNMPLSTQNEDEDTLDDSKFVVSPLEP